MDKKIKVFASIFDALVDSVYIIDENYTVAFANKTMIREFGDGTGKKCYKWLYQSDDVCSWCRAKEVFSGKTLYWEHYVPRTEKTYEIIEIPLSSEDGTVSKLSIFLALVHQSISS